MNLFFDTILPIILLTIAAFRVFAAVLTDDPVQQTNHVSWATLFTVIAMGNVI
jgi:hypothetical protein